MAVHHGERVAQAGHAGQLGRADAVTALREVRDDLGRRARLAAVHARSVDHHDRRFQGQRVRGGQRAVADVDRVAVAHGHAEHLDLQRVADVLVLGDALAEHAAEVQHVDPVAGLEGLGHAADEAAQRLARAQRAGDHVALADMRHAAALQLE